MVISTNNNERIPLIVHGVMGCVPGTMQCTSITAIVGVVGTRRASYHLRNMELFMAEKLPQESKLFPASENTGDCLPVGSYINSNDFWGHTYLSLMSAAYL